MTKKFDFLNSIKVIVSPWDKGFTCGILLDSRNKMSDEQYELCSTIARGMIKLATTDPHTAFLAGIRGFADDRKYKKTNGGDINEKAKLDDTENIIDFLKYLQRKRNKELN
tara:strand:- start:191 stop:523 length:333 start_codon:yes stop_codon:yes gene_type:complete